MPQDPLSLLGLACILTGDLLMLWWLYNSGK